MNAEAQRIAIAEACGWTRASALEARENGITILDRQFGGYRRKLLHWDYKYTDWHKIDIDESNPISTEELMLNYELPTYWRLGCEITRHLPKYPTDLNAMHEAEKVLFARPEGYRRSYVSSLRQVLNFGDEMHGYPDLREVSDIVHATAAQRAEAFLKTLGKWTND